MVEAKPKPPRRKAAAKQKEPPAAEPGVGQSPPPQPPPPADAAPKPKRGRRGPLSKEAQKAAELDLIQAGLEELLVTMPGMAGAATNDRWLVDHVTATGPNLAHQITSECARNDTLRRVMLTAMQGESMIMTGVALFSYAYPIAMHYGLAPGAGKRGIPRRGEEEARRQADVEAEARQRQQAEHEEQLRRAAAQEAQRQANGEVDVPPAESLDGNLVDVGLGVRPEVDMPPAEAI